MPVFVLYLSKLHLRTSVQTVVNRQFVLSCSILFGQMYHAIFIYVTAGGNLGNFFCMYITNGAFMNILIQVFW